MKHLAFQFDALETLWRWTWTQTNKQNKKKPKHLSKLIRFVHSNLVLEDIHLDQHTCQSKFWQPWEWSLGLGIYIIYNPLICKLVSMKVTVCGNGNRMGWWLLSVKTAHMASVARQNEKLRSRQSCMERWAWSLPGYGEGFRDLRRDTKASSIVQMFSWSQTSAA